MMAFFCIGQQSRAQIAYIPLHMQTITQAQLFDRQILLTGGYFIAERTSNHGYRASTLGTGRPNLPKLSLRDEARCESRTTLHLSLLNKK